MVSLLIFYFNFLLKIGKLIFFRSESSTSPLQMTLLESRGGGGGGDGARGPEVTTLTARYHSSNGTSNAKQKMMDTTTHEDSQYLLHMSQHQQQQQQRSIMSGGVGYTEPSTSPQRVPEVVQNGLHSISERIEPRHELKDWSEVSTVLLESPSDELKDQRHNLARDAAFNDRNNNNPSGNQMNF